MICTTTGHARKKPHQRNIPKQLPLLCMLLLLGTRLAAFQAPKLDSLWARWQNKALADTSRMDALLSFCTNANYVSTQLDSALYYAKQGYAFAQQRHDPYYLAQFLNAQGQVLHASADYYQAEVYYKRALHIADSIPDQPKLIIKFLNNLGRTFLDRSDHADAIDCFLRALTYPNASEPIYQETILANLGNSYAGLKDYDKALLYYNKSLQLSQTNKDTISVISALNNLSLIYAEQKDHPKALEALTRGLQLAKASNTIRLQGILYMNIGDMYVLLDEPVLAIDYYQKARHLHRSLHNKIGESQTLFRLAKSYRKQQPDSTLILARQALAIAQKADKKNLLANIARLLYETYETQGQYQPALEMYKLYSNTQDSIFNDQQQKSIFRSEAKYEYEKKQLEDKIRFEQELAQTKLAQQRKFYFLFSLIFLIVLGGYLLFRYRGVKFQEERAELLLKIGHLRQTVTQSAFAASGLPQKSILNKTKIEEFVGGKLGETSWNILQLLIEKPTISNREIAEALFLSEEGVSSSLRRMYSAFDIQSGNSKNHKIALLSKVIELSVEQYSDSN